MSFGGGSRLRPTHLETITLWIDGANHWDLIRSECFADLVCFEERRLKLLESGTMSTEARKHLSIATLVPALAGAALAAMPLASWAGTLKVVHNFTGGGDGGSPVDGLMMDAKGTLFGTTSAGGAAGLGTVFKMAGQGTQKVLHSFQGGSDGATPNGSVIENASGTLFGTTTAGGASGAGTVYSVRGKTETVLYSFAGGTGDGSYPQAGLVMDGTGNLYGTTSAGGASGKGTVFELIAPPSGFKAKTGAWTEKVLYSFGAGTDGASPVGRVVFDSAGNLYGTTSAGGTGKYGIVFQLQANANWAENILHTFQNADDGSTPYAGLVADASGNFYGAATAGGSNGGGTIFELSPSNGGFTFTVLASVPGWGVSGTFRDVLLQPNGVIYATTHCDGANSAGSIYELTLSGGVWTYNVLYNFTGGKDGLYSISNLVLKGGALYGTTIGGGAKGAGTVYAFSP